MEERILNEDHIRTFDVHLRAEEKSVATREKYLRDVRRFMEEVGEAPVTKALVAKWKNDLIERGYAVRSVIPCWHP